MLTRVNRLNGLYDRKAFETRGCTFEQPSTRADILCTIMAATMDCQ